MAQPLSLIEEGTTLDEAVESYIAHCEARGLSDGSVYVYRRGLQPLLAYLRERGVHAVEAVTPEHLAGYLGHRELQGQLVRGGPDSGQPHRTPKPISAAGLAGIATGLRMFFGYLADADIIRTSPAENLPRHRVPEKHIRTFSESQLERLLGAPDQGTFHGLRDWCVLVLLASTGMRVSEALGLTLDALDFEQRRIVFVGKGSRPRQVPMGASTEHALRQYLRRRKREAAKLVADGGTVTDHVFVSEGGGPMLVSTFARKMKAYARSADVRQRKVRISPHTLRHTWAVHFMRNGGSVVEAQRLLGHRRIETTMQYLRDLGVEHCFAAGRQRNPVDFNGMVRLPGKRMPRR